MSYLRCSSLLSHQNTLSTPPPSIDLSPLECHTLQQEELEALRAIYDQDLTPLNDDCTCFAVDIKFLSDEIRDEDVIKIWFRYEGREGGRERWKEGGGKERGREGGGREEGREGGKDSYMY